MRVHDLQHRFRLLLIPSSATNIRWQCQRRAPYSAAVATLKDNWESSLARTGCFLRASHTCKRKTSCPSLQARATGCAFLSSLQYLFALTSGSVCLTANGELFTWGANSCGELGRAEGDGWGYPQLVPTLMGTRISQVLPQIIRITIHTSRVIRLAAAAHSALLYRSTGSRMRGAGGNVQFLLTCSSLMPVPHQISATPTASSAACRPTASRSSHSPALSPNSSTFPLKSYPAVQQLLLPCARADTVTQTFSRRCKRRVEGAVPGRRYRAQTRPCGWETCLTGR